MERFAYTRTTSTYHENYLRNSKAVGVLWGIFTLCFAIVNVLVFVQPYWIGVSTSSAGGGVDGYIGLHQYCLRTEDTLGGFSTDDCDASLFNWERIPSVHFKVATVLVAASVLLILICVVAMILFVGLKSNTVYYICSTLQLLSFICLLAGCVVYPFGWDNELVQRMCGTGAQAYNLGLCEIRWSFLLAIIAVVDVLFLCILGFFLACKQVKMLPRYHFTAVNGAANGGFVNGGITTLPPNPPDNASRNVQL